MPSVDNIEQVYDVESPLEEAVKAILDALGFNTYTRTNAPDLSKEIERVEVIAKLGAATGHLRTLPMIAGGLTVRPDQWQCQLALQLITRAEVGDTTHTTRRATLRNVAAGLQHTVSLPFHAILGQVMDSGTSHTLKPSDGFEFTTLTYNFTIGVLPDAWPQTI